MKGSCDINGTSTAYEVVGDGPPLLLVHGAEGGRSMFDALVRSLSSSFTTIAYDQRECGETKAEPVAVGLEQLADDAAALIRALGHDEVHVFGTSFGGRIAQVLALRHPTLIDRLVLGSTWPVPQSLAGLDPEGRARIAEMRRGLPGTAARLAALFSTPEHVERNPDLVRLFQAAAPASERSQRRAKAVADNPPGDLSALRCRTMLVAGDRDRIVPPAVTMGMASQIPGAATRLLKGVGHAIAMQDPGALATCLTEFLLDTTAASRRPE